MATSYTSLLGLALPVTGELSGTWGDTVNNSITSLLDTAVAGTTTVSADTTLTTTSGAANQARSAIILASGHVANITITAPAQSKIYTVINTSGTYTVTFRGVGPTTGITLGANEKALLAWNGSDFVRVGGSGGSGVFSSITNTSLTSGRVVYSTTGGLETDSANLLFNGTTLTANTLNLTNALGTSYGGTGLTSFTSGGVVYASSSSALATGSALTFDGTNLGIGTSSPGDKLVAAGGIHSTGNPSSLASGQSIFMAAYTTYGRIEARDWTGAAWLPIAIAPNGGNVGIGTSSPGEKLTVSYTAAAGNIAHFAGANNVNGYIGAHALSNGGLYINSNQANQDLRLQTQGTDRVILDASGNLGLGVTPSASSSGGNFNLSGDILGGSAVTLGSNWYFNSGFKYKANGTASRFYLDSAGAFSWYTAPSGTAGNAISFTQAMTLDASGNLGIGTTSPGAKLDVSTTGDTLTRVISGATNLAYTRFTNGTQTTVIGQENSSGNSLASGTSAYASVFGTNSAYSLQLATGNIVRATIDSSGNLGLGATPSAWSAGYSAFDCGADGSVMSPYTMRVISNAYYNSGWKYKATGGASYYATSQGSHSWYTAPSGTAGNTISFTQAMTLDASGNLGLGVTPSAWGAGYKVLEIGTSGIVAFNGSAGTPFGYLGWNSYFDGSDYRYKYTGPSSLVGSNTGGDFAWYQAASGTAGNVISYSQRMTLDGSGNLGIGTSSPAQRLDVRGSIYVQRDSNPTNALAVELTNQTTVSNNGCRLSFDAYNVGSSALGVPSDSASLAFYTGGVTTERMRLDSSGNLTVPAMYSTTVTTPRNVFIDSTGKMGGISSSRASKTNISQLDTADWIYELNPVTFNYLKKDEEGEYLEEFEEERQFGLIAEEVELVKPELCIYTDDKVSGIHYDRMIAPLIKAIQELKSEVDILKTQLKGA